MKQFKFNEELTYRFNDERKHRGAVLDVIKNNGGVHIRIDQDYDYLLIDLDKKDLQELIMSLIKISNNSGE